MYYRKWQDRNEGRCSMLTNNKAGKLVLADGSVFHGLLLANHSAVGEVVFTTGMSGYQEVLTDPSYCGQIIVMTYPLIGNYGVAEMFNQSRACFARGFIVDSLCDTPNNWRMEGTIIEYLVKNNITCLYDVDTRAIAKKIRTHGVLKGVIVPEDMCEAEVQALLSTPDEHEQVKEVTTQQVYTMGEATADSKHVAVIDLGIKQNILHELLKFGCHLTVFPATATYEEIMAINPDGVFLSNGPGDPKDADYAIETTQKLIGKKTLFGICLGHQVLALAFGADTYKLKFGHRGVNHPVLDIEKDKVYIASQNHGYAVNPNSLENLDLEVSAVSVNDGTVEGLRHTALPIFSVQYHPEASPGPDGHEYLFRRFVKNMGGK